MKSYDIATRAIHAGQEPDPSTGAIMIDALNDRSLQTRIKKFDLERALDYSLQPQ